MAKYITLEEAKAHLYVEHDADDNYILSCMNSAEANLARLVNRPLSECEEDGVLPADLKHAVLILVGKYYAFREGTNYSKANEAPFTLANLFIPYRKEE